MKEKWKEKKGGLPLWSKMAFSYNSGGQDDKPLSCLKQLHMSPEPGVNEPWLSTLSHQGKHIRVCGLLIDPARPKQPLARWEVRGGVKRQRTGSAERERIQRRRRRRAKWMDVWWFTVLWSDRKGSGCVREVMEEMICETLMSGISPSACLPAWVTFDCRLPKLLRDSPQSILGGGSKAVTCLSAHARVHLCLCACSIHSHLIIVHISISAAALPYVSVYMCLWVWKWFKMNQRCSAE